MISEHLKVPISDLREHPRQAALFGDLPTSHFVELRADIEKNGLREPIRILPDRTIICGHQRVRVAKALGWTEVDAVIEEGSDQQAVEQHMILDNLSRRHLGPVGLARLYLGLRELHAECNHANGLRRSSKSIDPHRDLRDQVARRLGRMSGRTLDRYRRLLEAPPELQDAVESGTLSMCVVLNLLSQHQSSLGEIVAAIRAGATPKEAISRTKRLPTLRDRTAAAHKAYARLLRALVRDSPLIAEFAHQVAAYGPANIDRAAVLQAGTELLKSLTKAEKARTRSTRKTLQRLMGRDVNTQSGKVSTISR